MKKRKSRGGQFFEPTAEQRELVQMAAVLGISEERIVKAIRNPKTKQPISPKTLRRAFRHELDVGLLEADIQAGRNLLALTKTNATAAIFWAKVRLHWKETTEVEIPVATVAGEEDEGEIDIVDTARRIAFMLTMGARQAQTARKAK